MTDTPSTPATSGQLASGGGFTRRNMLSGLGLASLGLAAGPGVLGGGSPAQAQTLAAPAAPAAGPARLRAADGKLVQPGPYYLQASCELSQDWFRTSDVVLNAANGDRVLPFVNPKNSNAVEAIVFTHGVNGAPGTVSHLARSSAATSGWTYTQIDLSGAVPFPMDVAVATDSSAVYIMVLAEPNTGPGLAWLSQLNSATSWDSGYVATYGTDNIGPIDPTSTIGALKGGFDHVGGNAYFYAAVTAGTSTSLIGWPTGNGWEKGVFGWQLLQEPDTSQASVVDYIVLFDTTNSAHPVGYSLVLTSDGFLEGYRQLPYTSQGNPQFTDATMISGFTNAAVTELIWAWATPGSNTGLPGFAFQQKEDPQYGISAGTVFWDESGHQETLTDQATPGNNAVAVWLQDGLYTVNLLDGNGAVNLVQEISSSGTGSWAPALPLTTIPKGFAAIYSVPTDPSEATMFAVGADETLSVLSLGSSGWTQTQVHQDGAQLLELDSYRVQAHVLDANGAPVGLASVQVSTDRPVGFWQPGGNTTVTPAGAVTLTCDAGGQLVFSVPAEELDCAVLTMQALDSGGKPSGTAFKVIPDTDMRTFLGGAGSLLGVGNLSAGALLSAKTAAGGPLLTTLTGLPSDQQTAAATAVAGAFNQLITAGNTAAPSGPAATQAMLIDMSQATPVVQTSTNPNAYSITSVGTELNLSFSHLFDTLGQALRHAAAALHKTVVRWAEESAGWVVDLALKIGDDVLTFTDLVINGIKDAFNVVGGFFQALGADITGAIDWLKHNVLELIKDADANATIIQGWYTPFLGTLTGAINTIKVDTETFFTNLQTNANAQISALAATVETAAFGTSAPLPPPTPETGSSDADLLFKAASDVMTFMRHSPANWLLNKLREYLPQEPSDGGPSFSSLDAKLEQVIQDLVSDVAAVIDLIESTNTLLWDAVKPFLTDAGKFTESSMGAFFTALEQTTDNAIQLIEKLLITVLDAIEAAVAALQDVLDYQFQAIPVIGDLLELAHIDPTLSISRIVSLLAAYPTTLINNIIGDGPLFPPGSTPPTTGDAATDGSASAQVASSTRVDGWGVGLNWMSAVVQAIWSFNDYWLDIGAAEGREDSFKGNAVSTMFDIVCPVVINMLQFPTPTTDAGLTQPFWHGLNNKGDGTDLLPWMLFTAFIPPAAGLFYAFAKWKGFEDAGDYNDYGVPIFCAMAGVANTVLSSIYGHDQGVAAEYIAFGVLSNVSYDVAPVGFPPLNDALEHLPAIAKLIVDAIANFGTSIAMSGQAIAAAIKPLLERIPL
jgi:hypothetical protein